MNKSDIIENIEKMIQKKKQKKAKLESELRKNKEDTLIKQQQLMDTSEDIWELEELVKEPNKS